MKSYLITYENKQNFLDGFKILKSEKLNQVSTCTSYDVEELDEVLKLPKQAHIYSFIALVTALTGIAVGFGMQYYADVESMVLNIGGRPLNSWPAFIPVTFILLILFSALGTYTYLFIDLNLPELSHPIFFAQSFDLSKNHFQIFLKTDITLDFQKLRADLVEELK